MEKNFPELFQPDPKYQIIGQNAQVVQLLVMPNDIIYANELAVQYYSPNIKITKSQTPQLLKFLLKTNQMIQLGNQSKMAAYVGLGSKTGKIMVIDSILSINFWINESLILASTVQFDEDNKNKQQIGYSRFRRLSLQQDNFIKRHLIFLQTNGSVIEKELGSNESIIIRQDALFQFSDTIKLKLQQNQGEYLIGAKYLHLTGPGKVYFEGVTQMQIGPTHLQNQQVTKIFTLTLLFFIVVFTWAVALDIMIELQ